MISFSYMICVLVPVFLSVCACQVCTGDHRCQERVRARQFLQDYIGGCEPPGVGTGNLDRGFWKGGKRSSPLNSFQFSRNTLNALVNLICLVLYKHSDVVIL